MANLEPFTYPKGLRSIINMKCFKRLERCNKDVGVDAGIFNHEFNFGF